MLLKIKEKIMRKKAFIQKKKKPGFNLPRVKGAVPRNSAQLGN